jgi:hypothetical protein
MAWGNNPKAVKGYTGRFPAVRGPVLVSFSSLINPVAPRQELKKFSEVANDRLPI